MDAVVTGGAGFIGAHVVGALRRLADVDTITVLDDLSSGSEDNLRTIPDVRFVKGCVTDAALVEKTCAGADVVVHLAAQVSVPVSVADPLRTHDVNATGTVNVLEAARKHGLFTVVASSSAVYGSNPSLPKHELLAPEVLSPYAASKLATEASALAYQSAYDLPVLALRFFNVFGPLQAADHAYAAVIPSFISAAMEGRPLTVYGDGNQTRDFIDVRSVAEIIATAVAERVTFAGPVNVAFGTRRSLLDLIGSLEAVYGSSLAVEHLQERPGDVRHSQADDTRLRSLFPKVEPTEFTAALQTTVDWWRHPEDYRLV